jgi:hypothetical protein
LKRIVLLICVAAFFALDAVNVGAALKNENSVIELSDTSLSSLSDDVIGKTILLTLPKSTNEEMFKRNFELELIVPVETTDEYLFAYVKRVIFYMDKLIILTVNNEIFVVNAYSGKVETHINRKGNGPGESKNIRDIAFDDKMERILVLNDYKKLLYFDFHGKFLEEENIEKYYENIMYDEGNVIFYNVGEGYGCYPYALDIYNLQTKKWKKIGEDKKVDFAMRGYGRYIVKSKNIWFSPVLDLDMYILNNHDEIENPYKLVVKTPLSKELQKKNFSDISSFIKEVGERNILYDILAIRETANFMFFKPNLPGYFIMDKKTKELQWIKNFEYDHLGLRLPDYFSHDGDDNRIMFVLQADEWLKRKSVDLGNIPEHLKKQINSMKIDEDDNPILLFYKEKQNKD